MKRGEYKIKSLYVTNVNKSHSASYGVVTLCTMYLKKFYTAKFFAALLSMQDKEDKIDLYSKTAKGYGISITTPDINLSSYDFAEVDGRILYGLKSIKGVGEGSIAEIIERRNEENFTSIEDAMNRVEKKLMNKRVLTGLIKAGAFEFYNSNRYELLNEMMDLRKDKDDRYVSTEYNEEICMDLEKEVLGTSITYTPIWDSLPTDTTIIQAFDLISINERRDKKGNMMGFAKLRLQGITIEALIFASTYCRNVRNLDPQFVSKITLKGKKDSKGKFIVSSVVSTVGKDEQPIDNNSIEMYM